MKTILATILLAVTAAQANAEGFYQQVTDHANCPSHESSGERTEFTYTPLYLRVIGEPQESSDWNQQEGRIASKITQTPLYAKVMGNAS